MHAFSVLRGDANEEAPKSPANFAKATIASSFEMISSAAKSAQKVSVGAAQKAAQQAKKAGIHVPDAIVPQNDPSSDEENLVGQTIGPGAKQAIDEAQQALGGVCPALTYKQRLYGALGCIAFGFLLSIGATLALMGGKKYLSGYAIMYTLGNICSIAGSGFIIGPCRQAKLMCDPIRRVAFTIYFSTMVATILVAIYVMDPLLIFTMIVIQYCALIWYGASFVPFGRACITKACKRAGTYAGSTVGL